jgi:hypothetical protein
MIARGALVEQTLAPLADGLARLLGRPVKVPAAAAKKFAERAARAAELGLEERWYFAWAVCDAVRALGGASAPDAFDAWHIARALVRAWTEGGMDAAEAWRTAALVHVLVAKPTLEDAPTREMLGVHTYDGVEWFRKEPFEAWVRALAEIAPTDAKRLAAAGQRAGWRFQALCDLATRSPSKPPPRRSSRPPAGPSSKPPPKRSSKPPAKRSSKPPSS